jgi:hypothetical protein
MKQQNGFTTFKVPQTTVVLQPVPQTSLTCDIVVSSVSLCFSLKQPTPSGSWSAEEKECGRGGQAIYGGIEGDTPEMGENRRAIAKRNEYDGTRGPVPQVLSN